MSARDRKGERDGMSQPNETLNDDQVREGMAAAGKQMAQDMPSETEDALDRSLAVQGERDDDDVIGADEEE